jgi:hypothetical protein
MHSRRRRQRQHSALKFRDIPQCRGEPLRGLGTMELSSIEELARTMCRDVYESTNAQPNKWRSIGGGAAMRRALIYAVARGWLTVDWGRSLRVSLTDEGRREVRKGLS